MRQAAPLRMGAHGVSRGLAGGIGLVVADYESRLAPERRQYRHRHPRVFVPEDPDVPGTLEAVHDRREAVDREHGWMHAALGEGIERRLDCGMRRPEQRLDPLRLGG